MNYHDSTPPNPIAKWKRERNILWSNPPSIVGHSKQKLVPSFFSQSKSIFQKSKIFTRNTVKLRYFCISNIKTKINALNRGILRIAQSKNAKDCNCQQKTPLHDEWCLPQRKFSIRCYHNLQ